MAPSAVDRVLGGMAQLGPITDDDAVMALNADTHADVLISNLGEYEPPAGQRVDLTDLEGLVLAMGVVREQVITVVTSRGTMWLTHTAREPRPTLLDDMIGVLLAHLDDEPELVAPVVR